MRQNEAKTVAVKAHTPRVRLATIRLLRLSMVASTLPCFSSRIMAARDEAVSAVSLPE